jgi:hypothetical protein
MIRSIRFLIICCLAASPCHGQVVPVTIQGSFGNFQLIRNGQPYLVKGGGGDRLVTVLAAKGGNSMRTWGTDANTINFLNEAHANGITVLMGLWVAHEAHGFDYNNTAAVTAQREAFRVWVKMYKDHPAVLAWGIGNEVELGLPNYNPNVWNAINDISLMIKQEDGNHPTLTVVAGIDNTKTQLIKDRAPDLDMLGVNAYGGIGAVNQTLQNAGWNKPYLITEWGPNGQWESPTTTWGAPIEATSTEKAELYKNRYQNSIVAHPGKCLGSYVFLWSDKFEQTPTWYGLFLPNSNVQTQVVEEMQNSWSGSYPANRAPRIISATLEGKTSSQSPVIKKDAGNSVSIQAFDPDGDLLTYEYLIQSDLQTGMVNDPPATIAYLPNLLENQNGNMAIFRAPEDDKNYRLYIFVRDGQGHAATINIPFRVALDPLVSQDPSIIFASKDCYVRNGEFVTTSLGITDRNRLQVRFSTTDGLTRETYLSFNVSSINQRIERVWLDLYGSGPVGALAAIFPLSRNDWTETMAWGNKRTTEFNALDTVTLDGLDASYHRWEVTNYVNSARFFDRDSVSFILKHLTTTDNPSTWLSREARPSPPRLVFELSEGDIVLSANESHAQQIVIHPNPLLGNIFQISGEKPYKVALMNSNGIRYPCEFNRENNSVAVDDFPPGVYIVELLLSAGRQYRRLVKL